MRGLASSSPSIPALHLGSGANSGANEHGPSFHLRLEGKRACQIRYTSEAGGYLEDQWPAVQDQIVDAMVRLKHGIVPDASRRDADFVYLDIQGKR